MKSERETKAGIHGEKVKKNAVYWWEKDGGLVLHHPHGDLGFLIRRLPTPLIKISTAPPLSGAKKKKKNLVPISGRFSHSPPDQVTILCFSIAWLLGL